ncbi:DUF1232 domain-containing protein [Rhizobium sp. ARZ01]|uniref:YkvA family protein n=1 Tax=Rhizobium sp. ARZ01 TaxID=2769313 RepID=UPI001785164D|nr:YkvA family protein [Rhizobium sp. ARZ01]MBD9371027.1 DUF1232 domain-containing protein [Rhizobium sp. ARZ01]
MWLTSLKTWARSVKRDVVALWIAARDARTPLTAKVVAGTVAAYALSPVDLIPDFVPVLGYLDDLLIVPLGILLAVRLIPEHLMVDFRMQAEQIIQRPTSRLGLVAIVVAWTILVAAVTWFAWRKFDGP